MATIFVNNDNKDWIDESTSVCFFKRVNISVTIGVLKTITPKVNLQITHLNKRRLAVYGL